MGADLYIEPNYTRNRQGLEQLWKEALIRRDQCAQAGGDPKCEQEEVERINALMYGPEIYFRDSYNCFSMLNAFGLSWWTDIAKLQNQRGIISKAKARKLAESLRGREVDQAYDPRNWQYARSDMGGPVTREVFEAKLKPYWYERRDEFVRFLLAYAQT
jgi:hypothetical protein